MMNCITLVGRIVSDIKKEKTSNGNEKCSFMLGVSRYYKNPDGNYDMDFIPCITYNTTLTKEIYNECDQGNMVAIKGELRTYKNDNGEYRFNVIVRTYTKLSKGA